MLPSALSCSLTVGQLARRTGLTVRTLHHYEAIGLLVPGARTASGHRRYEPGDIERLQQIVSLRMLGLPLVRIRTLLDGGFSVAAALDEQIRRVRQSVAEGQVLLQRLETVAAWYADGQKVSPDDLLNLISSTTMFEKHYTPDQLDALQQRAAALGPGAIADVQQQWAALFEALDALRTRGVAPGAPEAQALARRGEELIAQFTGGDTGLRKSLDRAVAHDPQQAHRAWGMAPELAAYWQQVMEASQAGLASD